MRTTIIILTLIFALLVAGCGPSKAEREAAERQRLELEEKARRETEAANKAITEMNKNMFKKLTPEERAARDEERKRKAQQLVDEWKEQEAQKKAEQSAETTQP